MTATDSPISDSDNIDPISELRRAEGVLDAYADRFILSGKLINTMADYITEVVEAAIAGKIAGEIACQPSAPCNSSPNRHKQWSQAEKDRLLDALADVFHWNTRPGAPSQENG